MKDSKSINLYTKASQVDAEGNKNNIEFYVEAAYTEKGGSQYITYKETEVSGMEGTTTTLKITEGSLSIIRFGTYNSRLEFRAGETTYTSYQTPYGTIPLEIKTSRLDINLKPSEQSIIQLKYNLESGGEPAFTNEMLIRFQ